MIYVVKRDARTMYRSGGCHVARIKPISVLYPSSHECTKLPSRTVEACGVGLMTVKRRLLITKRHLTAINNAITVIKHLNSLLFIWSVPRYFSFTMEVQTFSQHRSLIALSRWATKSFTRGLFGREVRNAKQEISSPTLCAHSLLPHMSYMISLQ